MVWLGILLRAVGVDRGLTWGGEWWYGGPMPQTEVQAAARKSTAITNAGNRLEVAEIKKLIHESGVCVLAIEMAQTGKRPILDEKTGKVIMESLSEAAHVEMVKFIANKVLPNAKDHETTDDKEVHAHWAAVIEAENAKELVGVG